MNKGCVTFKGRKDGITVVLDENAEFSAIVEALREKITAAESFFGDTQAVVRFNGRQLSEEEKEVLVEIIKDGSKLDVLEAVVEYKNAPVLDDEQPRDEIKETGGYEMADNESMTVFQRGSLRSGQSIRYAGSVVLMGDVNAGAEIVAEGNVIVNGVIKGMVHAGCAGDSSCYVSALSMQPTQLRIADVIIYIPAEVTKNNKNRVAPVYAHISGGQIYISPLVNSNN